MMVTDEVYEYSPIIILLLSYFLLWDRPLMTFYYTVGIFLNAILNCVLKGIIRQPRPMFDAKKVYLATTNAKRQFYQNGIPFQLFGMPSGHSQLVFFSIIYIYLALKKTNWLWIFLLISLLICYQRVYSNYHTIFQVVVGAFVGMVFGFLMYQYAKENVKGRMREKPDDDAPV